jgi:hypothetical protein
MERTKSQSAIRRRVPRRGLWAVFVAVALVGGVVGFALVGPGAATGSVNGGAPGPTQSANVVKNLVFGGEIQPSESNTTLPITVPYPPVEAVNSYKVPSNMRLVIESAYVSINEQFGENRRNGFDALISSYYDFGPSCAYPGFERDYGITLGPPVIGQNELLQHGSLSGPIYVEGGRSVAGNVAGEGADSQVIALITVHGYLEPGVNPFNPKPPTCT